MICVNDIQGKYLDDIPQQVADAMLTPSGKLCVQRNILISCQKQTPFPYAKLHFRQHPLGPSFDGAFFFYLLFSPFLIEILTPYSDYYTCHLYQLLSFFAIPSHASRSSVFLTFPFSPSCRFCLPLHFLYSLTLFSTFTVFTCTAHSFYICATTRPRSHVRRHFVVFITFSQKRLDFSQKRSIMVSAYIFLYIIL